MLAMDTTAILPDGDAPEGLGGVLDDGQRPVRALLISREPLRLQQALKQASFLHHTIACQSATGLAEALTCLVESPVDVVLLDLEAPAGVELGTLKHLFTIAPNTPVVLVVGRDQQELAEQALCLGAHDYLTKESFDNDMALRCLHYVVESHRLQRALGSLMKDPVTDLYSRHAFLTVAEHQLTLAPRLRGMIAVHVALEAAAVPLSREHGLLARTAKILRHSFRKSDLLGRWGRFELAALAVDATPGSAATLLRRLREQLELDNRAHDPCQLLELHLGAATFQVEKPVTVAKLIGQAERAGRPERGRVP